MGYTEEKSVRSFGVHQKGLMGSKFGLPPSESELRLGRPLLHMNIILLDLYMRNLQYKSLERNQKTSRADVELSKF